MAPLLITKRLSLEPLALADNAFILELVNTKGWLEFIGDRNVKSNEDASVYIQKIMDNQNVNYWMVKLKDEKTSIGIITFIKRDYLEYPDIGFAFLPRFAGHGYAHEAAKSVLDFIMLKAENPYVLATTVPENLRSIKLLRKLDFQFEREINVQNERLHVYSISAHR